jgi:hypothetical protein
MRRNAATLLFTIAFAAVAQAQELTPRTVDEMFGDRCAACADRIRRGFDRVPVQLGAVTTVGVLAALTAFTGQQQGKFIVSACEVLPVSLIRVEVTFSATRYRSLLDAEGDCRRHVVASLVTWDLAFPVAYALLLCALYLWVERWRRFDADDNSVQHDRSLRRDILLLAPLLAGALDILLENVPLWIAARIVSGAPVGPAPIGALALVLVGSTAALLKWLLLLLSTGGILVEILAGPRGAVLWRVRFSALAVLLGGVPLLAIPQGQDILQRLFEDDRPGWALLAAVPPIIFAALAVWYCARKLTELHMAPGPFRHPAPDNGWRAFFDEQIPRLFGITLLALAGLAYATAGLAGPRYLGVGFAAFFIALLARRFLAPRLAALGRLLLWRNGREAADLHDRVGRFVLAAAIGVLIFWPHWILREQAQASVFGGPDDRDEWTLFYLRFAAYLCLVSAWLFQLFVPFRRAARHARESTPPVAPQLDTVDVRAVSGGLKLGIAAALAVSLAFLAAFTIVPVEFGRAIGALWVLSLATANAVFIGSVCVWIGKRYRVPVVTAALIAAALFSLWNDNHRVRTLEATDGWNVGQRSTVEELFASWRTDRQRSGADVPVILVAGGGGGLRAAYWTAMSLAVIQDQMPAFGRHVFAFSGVSGGSLGGALFAAIAQDTGDAQRPQCRDHGDGAQHPDQVSGAYATCVRTFMADDHLTPVLAKLIAPDLLQWFLPVPIYAFDRSAALEGSWEHSYNGTLQRATFRQGFLRFALDAKATSRIPVLLLNSTHVETGRRYSVSTARGMTATQATLYDAGDILEILHSDMPTSTAIHNSARFTYVSPAGHLDRADGREHGHVVDGGYFENSGLASLREIYDLLRDQYSVRPYVLYLCNDPRSCKASHNSPGAGDTFPSGAADEALSPVRALLKTRDARGSLARASLAARAGERFLQLDVCDERPVTSATESDRVQKARERVVSPPLGWLLSKLARNWMDSSLISPIADKKGNCYQRNAFAIEKLRKALTPPTASP